MIYEVGIMRPYSHAFTKQQFISRDMAIKTYNSLADELRHQGYDRTKKIGPSPKVGDYCRTTWRANLDGAPATTELLFHAIPSDHLE